MLVNSSSALWREYFTVASGDAFSSFRGRRFTLASKSSSVFLYVHAIESGVLPELPRMLNLTSESPRLWMVKDAGMIKPSSWFEAE